MWRAGRGVPGGPAPGAGPGEAGSLQALAGEPRPVRDDEGLDLLGIRPAERFPALVTS